MKHQHPLARSLVTARTWPFFIDLGVAACALAVFFAVVSTGIYWFQKPIPVVAFPWGSESTNKTCKSLAASEAARLIAVVVFPTPPF